MTYQRAGGEGRAKKGNLTPFGRECRRIRKERGLFMGDVCEAIGRSAGFLSQVETGLKPIPDGLVGKVVAALDLPEHEARALERAAALSAKEFRIPMDRNASHDDRQLAYAIEIGFAKLSPQKKQHLFKLLEDDNNG